jgi:hypothetical protein
MSKKLLKILDDPFLFISRLKIKDKKGRIVSLKPTDEQMEIMRGIFHSDKNLVVLKPRQIGSSTIFVACLFYLWYTSKSPITIAFLSHKLASSKHLLSMFSTMFYNLPEPLRREIEIENTTQLKLADTGAEVICVSSESKGGLRSFSAQYILLSEYSFAQNAEELKATAVASLNGGRLFQESTAGTYGDSHHNDVLRAMKEEGNMKLLFFPWSGIREYKKKLPSTTDPLTFFTEEEQGIADEHGLSWEQVYWRREKIELLGYYKFIREYPLSIEEAYGNRDSAYFTPDCFINVSAIDIDHQDDTFVILDDSSEQDRYAIGVDVASGVGKDSSVICVMSKTTYQPVALWSSNQVPIHELAERLEHIAWEYGGAKILIEENGIGLSLLTEMVNRGYHNLWKNPKNNKWWNTNWKTKWVLMEDWKEACRQGVCRDIDRFTVQEMRGFYLNDRGNIDYPENLPTHGDRVIAHALAFQCLKSVTLPHRLFLPDWVRHDRATRIGKKYAFHNKKRY